MPLSETQIKVLNDTASECIMGIINSGHIDELNDSIKLVQSNSKDHPNCNVDYIREINAYRKSLIEKQYSEDIITALINLRLMYLGMTPVNSYHYGNPNYSFSFNIGKVPLNLDKCGPIPKQSEIQSIIEMWVDKLKDQHTFNQQRIAEEKAKIDKTLQIEKEKMQTELDAEKKKLKALYVTNTTIHNVNDTKFKIRKNDDKNIRESLSNKPLNLNIIKKVNCLSHEVGRHSLNLVKTMSENCFILHENPVQLFEDSISRINIISGQKDVYTPHTYCQGMFPISSNLIALNLGSNLVIHDFSQNMPDLKVIKPGISDTNETITVIPNKYIISGDGKGNVSIFDINNPKQILTTKILKGGIFAMCASSNFTFMSCFRLDGDTRVSEIIRWDNEFKLSVSSPLLEETSYTKLSPLSDRYVIALSPLSYPNNLLIWNPDTNNLILKSTAFAEINNIAALPDGKHFIIRSNRTIHLIEIRLNEKFFMSKSEYERTHLGPVSFDFKINKADSHLEIIDMGVIYTESNDKFIVGFDVFPNGDVALITSEGLKIYELECMVEYKLSLNKFTDNKANNQTVGVSANNRYRLMTHPPSSVPSVESLNTENTMLAAHNHH